MKCECCGAEFSTGKRFCDKCGMPLTDHTAKPKEDKEESLIGLSKKIAKLKPEAEKIMEKKKSPKISDECEEILYSEEDDEVFDDED